MALFGHKDIAEVLAILMANQQQAPIRKTLGAESRPTRDSILGKLTAIEQLMQYKPTEEQRLQALRDMANTTNNMDKYEEMYLIEKRAYEYRKRVVQELKQKYSADVFKKRHTYIIAKQALADIEAAEKDAQVHLIGLGMSEVQAVVLIRSAYYEWVSSLDSCYRFEIMSVLFPKDGKDETPKPIQIEMPPLEINRSEHKAVNLFWDTLESILPK